MAPQAVPVPMPRSGRSNGNRTQSVLQTLPPVGNPRPMCRTCSGDAARLPPWESMGWLPASGATVLLDDTAGSVRPSGAAQSLSGDRRYGAPAGDPAIARRLMRCTHGRIRTANIPLLGRAPLPVGLRGRAFDLCALGRSRTCNLRLLKAAPLPVGPREQRNVPAAGLEPATSCFGSRCSVQLSYVGLNGLAEVEPAISPIGTGSPVRWATGHVVQGRGVEPRRRGL